MTSPITNTIAVLLTAVASIREEIARSRAFNSGLCLGMKLNEESDLYMKYKYLDTTPNRLHETAKMLENLIAEIQTAEAEAKEGAEP